MTNPHHRAIRWMLFVGSVSWLVACGDSKSVVAEDHGVQGYTLNVDDSMVHVTPGGSPPALAGTTRGSPATWMRAEGGTVFPELADVPRIAEGPGASLAGSNWTNLGGNAQNNGRSTATGPAGANLLWSEGRASVIAWHPFIEGNRVFVVRQGSLQPGPGDAVIVAYDLSTGTELWTAAIPFQDGQWMTWIAGVSNGRVYAARSQNDHPAPIYALSADTGAMLWSSAETSNAFAYDGVVFADNGDLLVGAFQSLKRIHASDGTTAWTAARQCSVSGNCGAARLGNAVYLAEWVNEGHVIARFDAVTGKRAYVSSVMPDASPYHTVQNSPFVGPDGSVYLSRTKSNDAVDYFFAFSDTGSALVERWRIPAGWTTNSHYAIGPDGSVYAVDKARQIVRLDPATGAVRNTSTPITDMKSLAFSPYMAMDAQGRLFVNNNTTHEQDAEDDGTVYSFNADLTQRWSVRAYRLNQGGPAIAPDGTMVLSGVNTDLRAYR